MSDTPITERQQHWLDHIQAAEDFDGSIADYARSEGLKPKELYSWKGILSRRGLLDDAPGIENDAGFVRVIAPSRPLGMSLVLPNGVRLEWHGDLGSEQLEALVFTASRLQ
ncbi:MAG: IS66 family insertion sequence element accessory protein TnpA [Hyphomicrobiaceae bacterium]